MESFHDSWMDKHKNLLNFVECDKKYEHFFSIPDSKVHGANMGPTWVLSAQVGPHGGPMKFAIRDDLILLSHIPSWPFQLSLVSIW